MKIENHITFLLSKQKSVCIPRLGTINAETIHSQIHPAQHQFMPPSLQFKFENNPNQTETMLLNTIIEKEKCSIEDAVELIKDLSNKIQNELQQKGASEITGLGRFYFDVEKKLKFISIPANNCLESSFGLPEFTSFPVLRRENIGSYAVPSPKPEKKKKKINWFKF